MLVIVFRWVVLIWLVLLRGLDACCLVVCGCFEAFALDCDGWFLFGFVYGCGGVCVVVVVFWWDVWCFCFVNWFVGFGFLVVADLVRWFGLACFLVFVVGLRCFYVVGVCLWFPSDTVCVLIVV